MARAVWTEVFVVSLDARCLFSLGKEVTYPVPADDRRAPGGFEPSVTQGSGRYASLDRLSSPGAEPRAARGWPSCSRARKRW